MKIDDECVDGIVLKSLRNQIKIIKHDIKNADTLNYKLNIADWTDALNAFKYVYDYYGGNLK